MARAQEREIDGVMYKAWPIPFAKGRPALVRLLGIVGPVLSKITNAKSAEAASALFSALPASLTDADLTYFANLFGDASAYKTIDGHWAPLVDKTQATHFEGRYLAFFQWLGFCVEVNFSGFFTGMSSALRSAALPPAAPPQA